MKVRIGMRQDAHEGRIRLPSAKFPNFTASACWGIESFAEKKTKIVKKKLDKSSLAGLCCFLQNNNLAKPSMILDRLKSLMKHLTDKTVFADLLAPLERALSQVRHAESIGRVLNMPDFIALGVLRHLQSMETLREQVQGLLHLDPAEVVRVPLARSTWSDALSASSRLAVLKATIPALMRLARAVLPDRLAGVPGLQGRAVRAIDGTYQRESVHYRRRTPSECGKDNSKGHALLTFFDLRLGLAENVHVDTRSRAETKLLRDYDQGEYALTREKGVLWLVDRAFIDADFWDAKKRRLGATIITRMKSNLRVDSTEGLPVDDDPVNEGVERDLRVTLTSSRELWRIVTFKTRRGWTIEFLTNDFDLQPGVVAFLFSRRWDEEKCFDTWKNDFSQSKAWGKSLTAIDNQVRLAIITGILIALMLHRTLGAEDVVDEKALRKQDKRQRAAPDHGDGTDRPDWAAPIYRHTSKVGRQVLRFFKLCFLKPASPALYERELRPMLMAYP